MTDQDRVVGHFTNQNDLYSHDERNRHQSYMVRTLTAELPSMSSFGYQSGRHDPRGQSRSLAERSKIDLAVRAPTADEMRAMFPDEKPKSVVPQVIAMACMLVLGVVIGFFLRSLR